MIYLNSITDCEIDVENYNKKISELLSEIIIQTDKVHQEIEDYHKMTNTACYEKSHLEFFRMRKNLHLIKYFYMVEHSL